MQKTISLNRNRDFRRLYNKGQSAAGRCVVVYCRPAWGKNKNVIRLGLTATVKLGNAVRRNRIRRRIRECYRSLEPSLKPGFDIVIVARSRAYDVKFTELQREMRALMTKLKVGAP
ncbi:ribonuclease P protein component [Clostridia bacterium]|nr:ribonuclease P protein component [Clostridia bacterium]